MFIQFYIKINAINSVYKAKLDIKMQKNNIGA